MSTINPTSISLTKKYMQILPITEHRVIRLVLLSTIFCSGDLWRHLVFEVV